MIDFGWAVIGCGRIANIVAEELQKSGAGKIVAVWNRTASKAENFAAKYGGKVYADVNDALSADGVDAVYIATTHDKHLDFTRLALSMGVPVLCEKPITVNTSQLQEAISLAKENDVYYAEAMWTWHNPVSCKVRDWIRRGLVGKIKSVRAVYAYPIVQFGRNPRLTSPDLIGGALLT